VTSPLGVSLDVQRRIAERGLRSAPRGRVGGGQLAGGADTSHPDAAATPRGLQQHGKSHGRRGAPGLGRVSDRAIAARKDRQTDRGHEPPRLDLVAHETDGLGRRPDERETCVLARLSEAPVLGEKSVAGMNGVRAGPARRIEDRVDREIALAGRGRTDRHRLVGVGHVRRVFVRFRIHGHARDAEPPARTNDPPGDLPPVRNQNFPQLSTWGA
jgi:hypothetical protein